MGLCVWGGVGWAFTDLARGICSPMGQRNISAAELKRTLQSLEWATGKELGQQKASCNCDACRCDADKQNSELCASSKSMEDK